MSCAAWFRLSLALILACAVAPLRVLAADPSPIVGTWEGILDPGAQAKKRIVVHISASQDGTLSGSIDYPDQDTSGVAINAITLKAEALHFESTGQGVFDGTMNKENSEISGSWKSGGAPLSLVLKRTP